MISFMWLIAIVVFLLLEAATFQFICIWFAGGALGSLVASMLGASLNVQMIVFFIVSALLLVLTRPFVKKFTDLRKTKTNIDSVPGQKGIVTEEINNISETGNVRLGGMVWTARSEDGSIIEKESIVEVVRVSGVKLIVKKAE